MIPWSQDLQFQTTCNQTDIWSPHFLRPDRDQFTGGSENFDPQIATRQPGAEGELPRLKHPTYGLMACKIESTIDTPTPDWPNSGFQYIYTFGGVIAGGGVSNEMRVWNPSIPQEGGGGEEEVDGLFSLVSYMPSPRAYGQAILIPNGEYRIALVGGYDQTGEPLNTVDVFTFGSNDNPQGGSWETFEGYLPEALEACGAGYNDRNEPSESFILTFGGWTGKEYSHAMYNARLGSPGDLVIQEAPVTVPRSNVGSHNSGSGPLSDLRMANGLGPVSFNRYYVFGGVDENDTESIVEVLSLP